MTTISAAPLTLPPPAPAGSASSPTPAKAASVTPSDTVAISAASGASSASFSGAPSERQVDSLINKIKTHNDIADARALIDWDDVAKHIGQIEADATKAASDAYLKYSTARIGIDLTGSGISIQPNTDMKGSQGNAIPSLLSVNNFSFKENGSTYAVTAGKNGTLVGTKDGQAWKTWQITPNHAGKVNLRAQTALSTLQGLLSQSKPDSLSLVQISA